MPPVITQVSNTLYSEEILRRSLPYVSSLNIDVDDAANIITVTAMYNNGLVMHAKCFHSPANVEELVNVCVAGAHQCLSELSYEALFLFRNKERTVKRTPFLNRQGKPNGLLSCTLESDAPRLQFAEPVGAPHIREVSLSIPQLASDPGLVATSTSSKAKPIPYDITNPRFEKFAAFEKLADREIDRNRLSRPKFDRVKADRATAAMNELLRTVGLDEGKKK